MANPRTLSDIIAARSRQYADDFATFYTKLTGQPPASNPVRDKKASFVFGDGGLLTLANVALETTTGTLINKIAPSTPPTGNVATDVAVCDEAIGTQPQVTAFRNAVGLTTLGGGYGGDAAADDLSALLGFVQANLPF